MMSFPGRLGNGLKKRKILKVLVPRGTVLCLGRFGSTPIRGQVYQYLRGVRRKPSCLFLMVAFVEEGDGSEKLVILLRLSNNSETI